VVTRLSKYLRTFAALIRRFIAASWPVVRAFADFSVRTAQAAFRIVRIIVTRVFVYLRAFAVYIRRLAVASWPGIRAFLDRLLRILLAGLRLAGIAARHIWRVLRLVQQWLGRVARGISAAIVESYLRLKIRFKLSLLVAVAIAVVTFVISTILTNLQERELRDQTGVLGTNIVRSLAALAEDNLLLNSIPVLQDYIVKNFARQRIPGLDRLFVMDRTGRVVAHLSVDSINVMVTPEEWDQVVQADSVEMVETPRHFIFNKTIYVSKDQKRILLGAASVRFVKATLLASIDKMRRSVIISSVLVSVLAIALVYLSSKRIVHVIVVLSDAARKVGAGDLKVTVVTRTKDELGVLASEFNNMVHQIREKTEMQKFVSRSTARMIAEGKEATLGGARQVITVVFTDIRDFTSVAESKWPEEVVITLNHYLDLQTKLLHQHGGVVDKFIGDGIMSIFSGRDMAIHAVEAALDIQRTIARVNESLKKKGETTLEVGIGISSGPAVLGTIGSQDRMDYTAIGDTVNIAARLCGAATAGEVLVSEPVTVRLNSKYPVQSAGKMSLKGKHEPINVFQVVYSPD
jgi:class 3 adenylate cyclase